MKLSPQAARLPALFSMLLALPFTSAPCPAQRQTPLDRIVRVFDTKKKQEIDLPALWDRLSEADAVFLGETHVDETTHAVELATFEGLLARRGKSTILAMEMFEQDEQPALDDYTAKRTTEQQFLHAVRTWPNYATDYRPLIEAARAHGARVLGSNVPTAVRRKLGRGGKDALAKLPPGERSFLPPQILTTSAGYWERFQRAVRGHMGNSGPPMTPEEARFTTQSFWDNSMGATCARALDANPKALVLHVNGGFHSAYRSGTVEQLRKRRPATRIATVDIAPTYDLANVSLPSADVADYVVFAERRARGYQSGTHAVYVAPELRFRMHMPADAGNGPCALLIWLSDDGVPPSAASGYWRSALGKHAAIAVVESPFPQVGRDLSVGARWFFRERFLESVGFLGDGLARIASYARRHFPVDRVVIAGEGSGAAMVVTTLLYGSQLDAHGIAILPKPRGKLAELGLPDPAPDAPARRRLDIYVVAKDQAHWQGEAKAFAKIGLPTSVHVTVADPLQRARATIAALADSLGLAIEGGVGNQPRDTVLVLAADTPLARAWALQWAQREPRAVALTSEANLEQATASLGDGDWRVLPLSFHRRGKANRLAPLPIALDSVSLPTHPSPFGGTTIAVVPAQASPAEREAWQKLAAGKPLAKRSRFTRLVLAFEQGSPSLADQLTALRKKGRKNVLIVPAMFCAGPARMQRLEQIAAPYAAAMNLAWRPGLGGR